jgi:hypothetical protein
MIGKVAIPRHTVVRIGTVYSRDGNSVAQNGAAKLAPHLRSAYARTQHFGPGNESTKIVFIPSCIVNYVEDAAVRVPRKELRL